MSATEGGGSQPISDFQGVTDAATDEERFFLKKKLEDTARYAGLLLAPAEGFGLRPRLFFALRAKKKLIMLFWPIFCNFWCPVVTLVTFSSNLSNFERNAKQN